MFVFLFELLFRIAVFRLHFFRSRDNLLDLLIVMVTCVDATLAWVMTFRSNANITFARLVRLSRLIKTFRFVRLMRSCTSLRVLIVTIVSSFMSFTWSMLVLLIVQVVAALFICQSLQGYLTREDASLEQRLEIFAKYGTAVRAFWTMFEVTFSGGWPMHSSVLIHHVSAWYGFFFFIYISFVVFAITRIITALFLKDTLSVASADTEYLVQQRQNEKFAYAEKMREMFAETDTSGDGFVSYEEFQEVLTHPRINTYFSVLEIDVHEVESLFSLLDNGDGKISYEEFLGGVTRLKGWARSQDVIMILHCQTKLLRSCHNLQKTCSKLAREFTSRQAERCMREADSGGGNPVSDGDNPVSGAAVRFGNADQEEDSAPVRSGNVDMMEEPDVADESWPETDSLRRIMKHGAGTSSRIPRPCTSMTIPST